MKKEYYNENGTSVSKHLESGMTSIHYDIRDAIRASLENKTYYYELFQKEWDNKAKINELKFIGYAVPRK